MSNAPPLPTCNCPACGKHLDTATSATEPEDATQPCPGDASVCFGCTSFLVFNADLTLRLMTEVEVGELDDTKRIQLMTARRAIQRFKPGRR